MFVSRSVRGVWFLVLAVVLGVSAAAPVSAQTFSGSFAATTNWFRYQANCAPEASARMVQSFGVFPRASGTYTFTATRSAGATVAIDIYSSFSAASASCGQRVALGSSGAGSASVTATLSNTAEYVLVVSSGTTADTGSYSVAVSGPGGAGVDGDCSGTGSISPSYWAFPVEGGAYSVSYTPPAGVACSGYLIDSPAWVLGFPKSASGSQTFPFSVGSNAGGPRTGYVNIGQRTLTISQDGTCEYSLGTPSTTVSGAGATFGVDLSVNSGCPWSATSANAWISLAETSGTGPGAVWFTVATNTGAARVGTLKIADQTFTVYQNAACTYALDQTTLDVGAGASEQAVSVTTQDGCPTTGVSSAAWIAPLTPGSGTTRFAISANTGAARSGTITLGASTITVNQASGCTITLPVGERDVPSAGQSSSFVVTTGSGCGFTVDSDAAWLVGTPGVGKVDFVAEASVVESRVGTLTVTSTSTASSASYVITQQSGCVPVLAAGGEERDAAAGEGSFLVTVADGCALTLSDDADWLAHATTAGGVGFTVLANDGPPRTGTITISSSGGSASYAVLQAAGCTIDASAASVALDASGTSVFFNYTTGAGCTISATDDEWFYTLLSGGVAEISGYENYGGPRSGTLTLTAEESGATAVVAVTQASSLPLPVIGTHPRSERAYVGDFLSLTVVASGDVGEVLSFQWRKDGVPIPGETADVLQFAALELEDAGSYDVVVSGIAGSVTSNVAVVEVSAGPKSGCSASSSPGSAWPIGLLVLLLLARRRALTRPWNRRLPAPRPTRRSA